eukprot:1327351-Rhodomonas_salina.4
MATGEHVQLGSETGPLWAGLTALLEALDLMLAREGRVRHLRTPTQQTHTRFECQRSRGGGSLERGGRHQHVVHGRPLLPPNLSTPTHSNAHQRLRGRGDLQRGGCGRGGEAEEGRTW